MCCEIPGMLKIDTDMNKWLVNYTAPLHHIKLNQNHVVNE